MIEVMDVSGRAPRVGAIGLLVVAVLGATAACAPAPESRASATEPAASCVPNQELVCVCGLDQGTQSCNDDGELTECTCQTHSAQVDPGDKGAAESPATAAGCKTDGQCAVGQICKDRECVKGCNDDRGCSTSQVCTDQHCVSKPAGTTCSDLDCVLGKICSGNTCVPGCHQSFDCPLEQTCVGGQCQPESTSTTGCWSTTLSKTMKEGACVQSSADSVFYQCHATQWYRGVTDGVGRFGACTSTTPL